MSDYVSDPLAQCDGLAQPMGELFGGAAALPAFGAGMIGTAEVGPGAIVGGGIAAISTYNTVEPLVEDHWHDAVCVPLQDWAAPSNDPGAPSADPPPLASDNGFFSGDGVSPVFSEVWSGDSSSGGTASFFDSGSISSDNGSYGGDSGSAGGGSGDCGSSDGGGSSSGSDGS